jgi:hypothetical protein
MTLSSGRAGLLWMSAVPSSTRMLARPCFIIIHHDFVHHDAASRTAGKPARRSPARSHDGSP